MEEIKEQKITLGRLVLLIFTITSIGSGAIALARYSDVSRHEERSINLAHPGIDTLFVSRREFQQSLRKIDAKLARIEAILESISKDFKKK